MSEKKYGYSYCEAGVKNLSMCTPRMRAGENGYTELSPFSVRRCMDGECSSSRPASLKNEALAVNNIERADINLMMIYLLNVIGLSPGGRSTVHIYTQTIHRTIENKQYIEQHNNFGRVQAVPRLGWLYPGICLTTEEKAQKNLSQGSHV
jgi:hypothetical protein